MTGVVLLQKFALIGRQIPHAAKASHGQKTSVQHAKEQLGLIEPRTVFGRKMKHVAMTGITPETPGAGCPFELLAQKALAPLSTRRQRPGSSGSFKVIP